ncbi:ARM repeat containing protein, putative [Babesia caballi]|uniref:ARM repeat containing protein, putative n=1 Tax=Babesia caballi TaxID=5871 RepID=A0AAV4LPH5_BABCB|nr:ARM repeat containing protein, putative [Babesia caballi]
MRGSRSHGRPHCRALRRHGGPSPGAQQPRGRPRAAFRAREGLQQCAARESVRARRRWRTRKLPRGTRSRPQGCLVTSLELETPCNTQLYSKIKIALDSAYMRSQSKERESSSDSDDEPSPEEQERTLLPFKGYKKILLRGYFLFVRESFEHTSFTSGSMTRLQDIERGISISVTLRDPRAVHYPELGRVPDLYKYSRGFLHELAVVEVLVDGLYNKRMNLNNDLATWSCYHLLVKTDSSLVAFFMFRRMHMPPMFDMCQDISVRFDMPLSSRSPAASQHPNAGAQGQKTPLFYNEICTTANSITASDPYNMWYVPLARRKGRRRYKDLIQLRLDSLRFDHAMYAFLKRQGGIVPSYQKLVKGFVLAVLRLLPHAHVDPHLVQRLKDPVALASDEPMDYVYNIKALMFGIGDADESADRRELINRFDMRLADYIGICIDELLAGSHLSLAILTRYLNSMEDDFYKQVTRVLAARDSCQKLRDVAAYLMHFRSNDFSKEYSPALLDKMIDAYRIDRGVFAWSEVVFNHHATSRMIEEGFFIHQYAEDLRHLEGTWNPYVNLVTDLIEQYRDDVIMERVLKKFLDIPQPADASYLPLLKCLIGMLRRHSGNYKMVVIITSILTNFSFHSAVFKDHVIRYGVATVLIDNMLSNEDQIVLSTLKLMINVTKTPEHQQEFISHGVISNFITVLEVPPRHRTWSPLAQKYYARHIEIIGYSAGVLGQLFNSGVVRLTPNQLEYITEVMIFSFHVGSSNPTVMVMIMFCLKKLPKSGAMYIRIGRHVIRSIAMNLKLYRDDDFVVNSLELLLDLTTRVHNCAAMRLLGVLEAIEEVPLNDTLVQIANKLKERIMRKTRCLDITT